MENLNSLNANQEQVTTNLTSSYQEITNTKYKSNTPLFVGLGVLFLLLGAGGVFMSQPSPITKTISPTVIPANSNPINMKTFNRQDVEPLVTLENATDVTVETETAIKYGLDNNTLNRAIRDAFANGLQ